MKPMKRAFSAVILAILISACGGGGASFQEVAPTPRRLALWLGEEGLDAETAERMRAAGVDQVVVRPGSIDLAGRAPVLRFRGLPPVEGAIPVGIALEVRGTRPGLDRAAAEAVWRAIDGELDGAVPAEIILDVHRLTNDFDDFVDDLTTVSGISVVPLLSFEQLQTELDPLPLDKKLESLVGSEVRVRLAVVMTPRTDPPIEGPGDDLDPLTRATIVSTASTLDRTFTFESSLSWSGRTWQVGDTVAVRWFDAARLDAALSEIHRLLLPEVAGWDLVSLPPEGQALGLGRESLLRYLEGEGPGPDVEIEIERNGRNLQVSLVNAGPFATAVTNYGNWVQVSVEEGMLRARDRGSFDGLRLGLARGDDWQEGDLDQFNAVRFSEVFVGPEERVSSGSVRLPSTRSKATVKWNLSLSDGSVVTGEKPG
jgi:hypothetical protein